MEKIRRERAIAHVRKRANDKYPITAENVHIITGFVVEFVEKYRDERKPLSPEEREVLALDFMHYICETQTRGGEVMQYNETEIRRYIQLTCKAARGKFLVNAGPLTMFKAIGNWACR
jgi:hypothetical protein